MVKKGCSVIVFLMLIVVSIFVMELVKNNNSAPIVNNLSNGCSSGGCALNKPRENTALKNDVENVEETLEKVEQEIVGFSNNNFGSPY